MSLSKDQIKHIAKLARLDLSVEELEKYGKQLSVVLDYINQLQEVNTNNIEPTAQVTELYDVFRNDEILNWDSEEIENSLKKAPQGLEERQIIVKIILK